MKNKKKLALLSCFLTLALTANAKELSLEERVEQLEKLLQQQIEKNIELEKQINLKEEKDIKSEEKIVKVQEKTTTDIEIKELDTRLAKLEKEAEKWEVHGYASLQYRSTDDFSSSATTFGKGDLFLGIPGTGESANQVEFVIKRKFEGKNGVFGDLNLRAEYGNGDSYYYSSSGSEHDYGRGHFEVKEAFINMGGFDYLPENSTIWAGRRFLNRNSTALSGEFYKQSSGVGFGYERNGLSLSVMAADPQDGNNKKVELEDNNGRKTVTAFDINYAGIQVPGGSLDLGAKYYIQPNAKEKVKGGSANPDAAKEGFGLGIVYNTNYYGFDGFASHAINYGQGVGAHATGGMNFGSWTDNANEDAWVTLLTSGGMLNLNDNWQLMTEATLMHGDKLYGLSGELTRAGLSIQPSYKVNDNFRWVFGATAGLQRVEDYDKNWGGLQGRTEYRVGLSIAPTFTADSDFFGRPQIQPFVTWMHSNFTTDFNNMNFHDLEKGKSQVIFGVKSEVWF